MEYGDFHSDKKKKNSCHKFKQLLLSLYCSYVSSSNIGNEDFLNLAVEDFNICQSIQREELKDLARCISLCSFSYHDIITGISWNIHYGRIKGWHV